VFWIIGGLGESVNLYLLQASALIAANHFAAVVYRRDRLTDGRTVSRPAAYYVGSSVNSSVFDLVLCLQLVHAVCGGRIVLVVWQPVTQYDENCGFLP